MTRRRRGAGPSRVTVAHPTAADMPEFLEAARRSRTLHAGFVSAPKTPQEFRTYRRRVGAANAEGYLVRTADGGALVGVVNMNEIVRGQFQSAYLGYYAFTPHAGQGLMAEGLAAVIRRAFGEHRLHRLEANIQPHNKPSIALARRLGFRLEGVSPRYLKVAGRWSDHERWALVREDWMAR